MTEPSYAALADSGGGTDTGSRKRKAQRSDSVALLQAVVEFRLRTGSAPTSSTVADFLESSASFLSHLSAAQILNKLRHLRHRHNHGLSTSSPDDQLIQELCYQAWGSSPIALVPKEEDKNSDDGNENENVDNGVPAVVEEYPFVLEAVGKYCREKRFKVGPLEESLRLVARSKIEALEAKWRKHWCLKASMLTKRFELSKELLKVLMAAEKGSV